MLKFSRMFNRITACIIFFTFSTGSINAQPTIFENTVSHLQHVRYETEAHGSEIISNYIITEIARSIPKNIDVTSFTVEFLSTIRLKQLDSANFSIFGELKEMRFRGDLQYRKMNISHLLVPDYVSFQVVVKNTHNPSESVYSNSFNNVVLSDHLGYFTILQTQFTDKRQDTDYIASLENLKLVWDEPVRERFSNISTLINEYFNADLTIENLLTTLQSINVSQLERVAFNNIVLKDAEKEFSKLKKFNFPNELNLFHSDPIDFIRRMELLEHTIDQLRFQINKNLEQLDQLYYEKGLLSMGSEKYDSARYYFRKAIEYNLVFVPALTELAYLEYLRDYSDSAASRMSFVHEYTIVSPEQQVRVQEVTALILQSIKESVQRKIHMQNYVEAEQLLNYAMRICSHSTQFNCLKDMEQLMAQIKYGLYRSLNIVIDKAIENKRFEIAYIYINHSFDFQRDNSNYIITPSETEKYWDVLFRAVLREIDQLNNRKQYVKALDYSVWLEGMCDTISALDRTQIIAPKSTTLRSLYNERIDKIEQDILKRNFVAAETRLKLLADFINSHPEIEIDSRYIRLETEIQASHYYSAISEAITNMQYDFYDAALKHLQDAYVIQEQYNIKKHPKIDSLFRIVATPAILRNYNKILSGGGNQAAEELLRLQSSLSDMTLKAGLSNTDTFQVLERRLSEFISIKICESLLSGIHQKMAEADKMISTHKFTEADRILEEALNLPKESKLCDLPLKEIQDLKTKVATGVEWENSMKELQFMLDRKRWKDAIDQFLLIDRLSTTQVLFMWGVERTELSDFIVQYRSSDFVISGFEYFYEKKQYDEAFKMLDNLRTLNYPGVMTKKLQTNLGHKLAVRDKIANPGANFRVNILKYTEGEEYFLYFSKSYRKTWRRN